MKKKKMAELVMLGSLLFSGLSPLTVLAEDNLTDHSIEVNTTSTDKDEYTSSSTTVSEEDSNVVMDDDKNSQEDAKETSLSTRFCIDSVGLKNRIFDENFQVSGWLLSPYQVESINVISQGKVIATGSTGGVRPDVSSAYPLYNQANPGFNIVVPTIRVPVGLSNLTIQYKLSNGEIKQQDVQITRADEKPRLYLDLPATNQALSNQLTVKGWTVAKEGISSVSVTLDGQTYPVTSLAEPRKDVYTVFPEFNNENAGFSLTVDTTNLALNKVYPLTITSTTNSGEVIRQTISVQKEALDFRHAIDTIFNNQTYYDQTYPLSGWVLSNVPVKGISVLIDGNTVVKDVPVNDARPDVNSHYPQFGMQNSGFSTTIDFSGLSGGNHTVTMEVILSNGTTQNIVRNIKVEKKENRIYLDTIDSGTTEVYGNYIVKGWALGAKGKITRVEAYLNGTFFQEVESGLPRLDVYQKFSQYNDKNSGFSFVLDTTKLPYDQTQTLQLRFTDENNQTFTKEVKLQKTSQTLRSYIDNLPKDTLLSKDYQVKGWAIGNSELVKVEAKVNGQVVSKDLSLTSRSDVANTFPKYVYGPKGNGFNLTIDWAKLSGGTQTIHFVSTFADGTTTSQLAQVKVDKLEGKFSLDAPIQKVTEDQLTIRGWALRSGEIAEITAQILESIENNETILSSGLARPDVYQVYPQYNNKNSGFSGTMDISNLKSGSYTLKLTVKEVDGPVTTVEKKINIEKTPLKHSIDSPAQNAHIYNGDLSVRGWFLADEGAKNIQYYLNGEKIGTFSSFSQRSDVNNAYPEYQSVNSGYLFTIANEYFKAGQNELKLVFTSQSGRQVIETRQIINNWTIVIDPGHGGLDSGATGFGVYEKNLNLSIGLKVEEKLKNLGYTLLMTRDTDIYLGTGGGTWLDLSTRAQLANKKNADLFVSIHHNSAGMTARGIETYVQDTQSTPNNGVNQTARIQESRQLATKVQNNLVARTGFIDRGVRISNFHVIRETKMPAILIEGGFVSNQTEATIMNTAAHQDRAATAITEAIRSYIQTKTTE